MSTEMLNLSQATTALATGEYPAQWAENLRMLTQRSLSVTEFASEVERVTDGYVKATISPSGNIIGYTVRGNVTASTIPATTSSNAIQLARGTVSAPVSTTVAAGQTTVTASRLTGVGTKVVTAASKLAIPLTLASVGITLGKTIDEVLYNANPGYWDSVGLSTLNPQTWSDLAGGNELGETFINAIFGIDPNTGEAQAYIDAEMFAYAAYALNEANFFAVGEGRQDSSITQNQLTQPILSISISEFIMKPSGTSWAYAYKITDGPNPNTSNPVTVPVLRTGTGYVYICFCYTNNPTVYLHSGYYQNQSYNYDTHTLMQFNQTTINGNTYYYRNHNIQTSVEYVLPDIPINTVSSPLYVIPNQYDAYIVNFGEHVGGIDGIGDQTGATIPNFAGLDQSQYLPYLQQTYPDMFNNAITYPVIQPDGTIDNKTYVPITLPDTSQVTGTQPVSGNQSQADPAINPSTATQELIDLLTKLLQQPQTEPMTDDPTPPENPTDTGDGSSPVPIVPVGSASSLWKIYHPTQAQIDSFGGWLWSSNFIDQILKIFNNPMEAVIGLHKIYATPVDAGTATIKVGYLDSGVSSAYIEQQYITVSCGSVNLYEQFGNVFDYSPFTDVQLYLPFVGIVPLNVADVMRSTISIEYGVDVITGACLAQVEVSRDGNSSVLYQYSGNCAVQYPISSGSYMGIVSSIISVAGGVAATVASGGAAAPLALGAAGGLLNAHTSVQHSGGFSGNSGAMGGKIPYLIITRPQTKVAFNAESMIGKPTNEYVTIGECSGYIKADSVHVINVNATDEELTMINDLILSGIII